MLTGSIIGDIKYQLRYGNMVVKLIFVNVSVFLFFGLLYLVSFLIQSYTVYGFLLKELEIPASLHALIRQPWSVFTYAFLHANLLHVAFNMLWLYWFGDIFVLYLGDKKVLPLYILGGLGGALLYLLAYNLVPYFKPSLDTATMLGASASIMAIVFAAATVNPNHELSLLLFGTVKIKYIALVTLLLSLITIPLSNAGGNIAHVGGALTGFLYIKGLQSGFDPIGGLIKIFSRKPAVKVGYKNSADKVESSSRTVAEQERLNEILDKISRSGYDSLSKEERDFLFNYSKK